MKVAHVIMKNKIGFAVIVSFLLLQGCASNQGAFVKNKIIDNWSLNGKIAVVYPRPGCTGDNCRKRSDQGKISWSQIQNTYYVTISDPFGRKILTAKGDSDKLRVFVPGKASLALAPQEFLTLMVKDSAQRKMLSGVSPDDLGCWITGRPNLREPFNAGDNVFSQKGFQVRAHQWRETPMGKLPSLVVIKKNNLTVRVVAREWARIVK